MPHSDVLPSSTLELPSNHVAQAHAHFADHSGFDATGQNIIGQQIANAVPSSNPSGVAGAAIFANRGGLMVGGPGNNTFFARLLNRRNSSG